MAKRIELHNQLLQFLPNVYFQPPADIRMTYPCIVYKKVTKDIDHANDSIYKEEQEYLITVMDRDPDSTIADEILRHFQYAAPGQFFVVDNINQQTIKLYY